MRETDFIEKNKDKWERYEASLKTSDQDPELLNQLYVHTTDDLSISRTFYPNRSVRVYLNGLAQRTFLQIYRGRRGQVSK
ncbi:MAG: stage II sporulation protein M, partial [Lewinella sp.]